MKDADEQPDEEIQGVRRGKILSIGALRHGDGYMTFLVWLCLSTWKQ